LRFLVIAVLNGIVLIEEFKELKAHGISDINERILMGTNNRLRPVLLTAAAAALGFYLWLFPLLPAPKYSVRLQQ
jgi:Cu/Ag efflux pump CusA